MSRSRNIVVAVAFGAAGMICALAASIWLASHGDAVPTTPHPVWAEVQWPFPIDEWGTGKVFQCSAADCGAEVSVYIRAKLGFCNCTTGVADDADRPDPRDGIAGTAPRHLAVHEEIAFSQHGGNAKVQDGAGRIDPGGAGRGARAQQSAKAIVGRDAAREVAIADQQ